MNKVFNENCLTSSLSKVDDEIVKTTKLEVKKLLNTYPTPESYLESEFGIKDVMTLPLPNYHNINDENIIFGNVRGNTKLMNKSIMTYGEADSIIERVKKA